MSISSINSVNMAQKNNVIPFKGETTTQTPQQAPVEVKTCGDCGTAKTASIVAALGSIGTLVVAGIALKKANNLSKEAKPLIAEMKPIVKNVKEKLDIVDKLTAGIQQSAKDINADEMTAKAKLLIGQFVEQGATVLEKVKESVDAIMSKLNPETLENIGNRLSEVVEELGANFSKIVKDTSKVATEGAEGAAEKA